MECRFDEARISYLRAVGNGAPDVLKKVMALTEALWEKFSGSRSGFRLFVLLQLGDHESSDHAWREVFDQLGNEKVASIVSAFQRVSLAPSNLNLLQRLIKSTPAEEILLPVARAIDYLISRDRNIIEKLSAEVRPIVQEIVAEYEKKYPQKSDAAPRRSKRKSAHYHKGAPAIRTEREDGKIVVQGSRALDPEPPHGRETGSIDN